MMTKASGFLRGKTDAIGRAEGIGTQTGPTGIGTAEIAGPSGTVAISLIHMTAEEPQRQQRLRWMTEKLKKAKSMMMGRQELKKQILMLRSSMATFLSVLI